MQTNHQDAPPAALAANVATLSQKLRFATAELHDRAEKHAFQASVVNGTASKFAYAAWLRQLRALHSEMESAFIEHVDRAPELASVIAPDQFKTRLIDDDLRALAPEGSQFRVTLAADAMAARIRSDVTELPLVLLGYWYVLEGATNGNKFLVKALSQAFGDGAGVSYLDPYGEHQRQHWMLWKTRIDQIQITDDLAARIVDAAKAMFLVLVAILDALWESGLSGPGISIDGLVAGHTLPLQALRRTTRASDTAR